MVSLILTSKVFSEDINSCIYDAGNYHGINPKLLIAIAKVESNMNPKAVNTNKDGSKDYGMFQINERNLKRLGFSIKDAFDPCVSAYISAYILKTCVKMYGYSWKAIDCYNKGHRSKGYSKYVRKVIKVYRSLN